MVSTLRANLLARLILLKGHKIFMTEHLEFVQRNLFKRIKPQPRESRSNLQSFHRTALSIIRVIWLGAWTPYPSLTYQAPGSLPGMTSGFLSQFLQVNVKAAIWASSSRWRPSPFGFDKLGLLARRIPPFIPEMLLISPLSSLRRPRGRTPRLSRTFSWRRSWPHAVKAPFSMP
jgi:hypothetical protein